MCICVVDDYFASARKRDAAIKRGRETTGVMFSYASSMFQTSNLPTFTRALL